MSNRIKYRYIGDGAFVVGVPARDIREEEAAEFEEIIIANLETPNPCYRAVHRAEAHEPKPHAKAESEDKQRTKGAEELTNA